MGADGAATELEVEVTLVVGRDCPCLEFIPLQGFLGHSIAGSPLKELSDDHKEWEFGNHGEMALTIWVSP